MQVRGRCWAGRAGEGEGQFERTIPLRRLAEYTSIHEYAYKDNKRGLKCPLHTSTQIYRRLLTTQVWGTRHAIVLDVHKILPSALQAHCVIAGTASLLQY